MKRKVQFALNVTATSDRDPQEFAEGVALFLKGVLNENSGELPPDAEVSVIEATVGTE